MIEIIFESFNSLFHSIDTFLNTRDLTLGAILAGVSPFIVLWIKISNEKGKRAKQLLIERRQLQIAFNVNELLEALKVESKWSLQEITSSHAAPKSSKKLFLSLLRVFIRGRKIFMDRLKSRKFWMTIAAALIPIINKEFGLNLDLDTIIIFSSALMVGVGFIAHVDAKKILAGIMHVKVTPQNVALAYDTYKEALPHLQEIHNSINKLLIDVKQDNNSEAFKEAMSTYMQIKAILDSVKHPEPVIAIVDEQVSA